MFLACSDWKYEGQARQQDSLIIFVHFMQLMRALSQLTIACSSRFHWGRGSHGH